MKISLEDYYKVYANELSLHTLGFTIVNKVFALEPNNNAVSFRKPDNKDKYVIWLHTNEDRKVMSLGIRVGGKELTTIKSSDYLDMKSKMIHELHNAGYLHSYIHSYLRKRKLTTLGI